MKHWWQWTIFVATLLIFGGLGLAIVRSTHFQKWYRPPILALPADGEVIEMRASLHPFPGMEAVPEFVVPPAKVEGVLAWLRPGKFILEPWNLDLLQEMGTITIKIRDDRELRIRFFDAGKNPAVLTVDGVDQFYGQGGVMDFYGDPHSIAGAWTLYGVLKDAAGVRRR